MPQPPFDNKQYKMPGYTGHIMGTFENYGKTPVGIQEVTRNPDMVPAEVAEPNTVAWELGLKKEVMHDKLWTNKGTIDKREELWPNLATQTEKVTVAKKNELRQSSITMGDARYRDFYTTVHRTHSRPGSARQTGIRNGVRNFVPLQPKTKTNDDLIKPHEYDAQQLKIKYSRAIEKANNGPLPLIALLHNINLRFRGKVNVMSNRNGFGFKQIFSNFDVDGTGSIDLDEFKAVMVHYGMQFDDHVYLALFATFDTNCNGLLDYREFMSAVLDPEYYSMAFGATGDYKLGVDDVDNKRYNIAK